MRYFKNPIPSLTMIRFFLEYFPPLVWLILRPYNELNRVQSEILSIIFRFFCFNFYRMSVGIDYDWSCSSNVDSSEIIEVDNDQINDTLREMYTVSENLDTNTTVFLKEYPCEWGFYYLTSGAAVWLAFLPFYITQLLGNCWRQCCCCLCDPLVMNSYTYY